jgi:regulator of replication initiation timing
MTYEEQLTLARDLDRMVEKYGAEGDNIEELTADLRRKLADEQARLQAEVDQLEARLTEIEHRKEQDHGEGH